MPNKSNIERTYEFTWIYEKSKYDNGVERHNKINRVSQENKIDFTKYCNQETEN